MAWPLIIGGIAAAGIGAAGQAGLFGSGRKKTTGIGRTVGAYANALSKYYPGIAQKLFDIQERMEPGYADLQARELQRLLPGVESLFKTANPQEAALLEKLLTTANAADLEYGAPLPDKMLRLANQMSRQGQAARGLGYGPADVFGETADATRLSADLVDRNRSFALDAAQAGYSFQTDPILRMLYGQQASAANAFASPAQAFSLVGGPPVVPPSKITEGSSDIFGALMGGGLGLIGRGIGTGSTTTTQTPAPLYGPGY
jgi:hypothetical protein